MKLKFYRYCLALFISELMKMISFQYNCQCMLLVSSRWLTSYASKSGGGPRNCASKRGGCPKAVLVSSGGAQNCASKLRVTILLRDPLTIPASRGLLRDYEPSDGPF